MESLAKVERRIASLEELLEVVTGIRGLAAARAHQTIRLLEGARAHAAVVAEALRACASLLPEAAGAVEAGLAEAGRARGAQGERVVVVLGSEQGFVGGFNEQLWDAAAPALGVGLAPPARLLVAGTRGVRAANERGIEPAWTTRMATRAQGVLAVARRIAAETYASDVASVEVFFQAGRRLGERRVERLRLLPLDLAAYAHGRAGELPPLRNLPREELLRRVVGEYVLAELVRAATESFASENAARLAAMTAAHESVERKLEELGRRAAQLRQDEVTTELLDVITGVEALRGEGEDRE
ncbi:MAG: F0F1 ATP synthase subunit gamma [Planctomycetota bacterium]